MARVFTLDVIANRIALAHQELNELPRESANGLSIAQAAQLHAAIIKAQHGLDAFAQTAMRISDEASADVR